MKTYTCELCNGTQFAKTNGSFVCQSCGTMYTLNEMKNLLSFSDEGRTSTVNTEEKRPTQNQFHSCEVQEVLTKSEHENTETEKKITSKVTLTDFQVAQGNNQKKIDFRSILSKIKENLKFKHIILGGFALFSIIFFIVSLIKACDTKNTIGNNMLIVSGIFELLIAYILYKIIIHIERYRCPECASKRVHHRKYIRTSETDKTFNNQGGPCDKTIYTHHYVDTYVCPTCGETRTERVAKSGGEYLELSNGHVKDTRKPPKEF